MNSEQTRIRTWAALLPGLALCLAVSVAAELLERAQAVAVGRAWLEALVLAILLGTTVRTLWTPPPRFDAGIHCASKSLLELAVMVMGATVSFGAIEAAGTPLVVGIVGTVFVSIAVSYVLGVTVGLPAKMALLVACGNSICGNSAIAAVAPVIDAQGDDVATAIAFTAVLGVAVVLLLPVLAMALHLSASASGVLAGLTVYAVPQVLAAAAPMGTAAVQVGTLVKLVRVLMLGPVVTVLSLLSARDKDPAAPRQAASLLRFFPAFILGFLALATARSLGLLPLAWIAPAHAAANGLTVVAMAGLGLGVDLRHVTAAGPRVSIVVVLSLVFLTLLAFAVLRVLGMI